MNNTLLNTEKNKITTIVNSLKKDSRHCIIECSVYIEEIVTETLGRLLDLDWEKSESLGYGSAGLGFNNKIRLIQDIKTVEKQNKAKFQSLMAIRNKFAHISSIDSFESYFKLIKSSKEQKNNFRKWFPHLKEEITDIEKSYKHAYFLLTLELQMVLVELIMNHISIKTKENVKNELLEKLVENLKIVLNETDNGNEILQKAIDKTFEDNGS